MTIDNYLANLNAEYLEITDLVSDIFYFTDSGDSIEDTNYIDDGGEDLFDNGNYITFIENPTFGGEGDNNSVVYTHTQSVDSGEEIPYLNPPMDGAIASAATYDSADSQYFTNMYPGLFVAVFTGITGRYFTIYGNMGSDGAEIVTSNDENLESIEGYFEGEGILLKNNYKLYTRFSKDGDGDDPSLNHLIIVKGTDTGWIHRFSGNENQNYYDTIDFGQEGPIKEIYYLMVATQTNEGGEPIANALAIANKFLEIIDILPSQQLLPKYTFKVQSYTMFELINIGYYGDFLTDVIRQREERTVWVIDRALKHGDIFVKYGEEALRIKKLYVDGPIPKLKLIENCEGSNTVYCGEECVDFKTDENNCGECGLVCDSGFVCHNGDCTPDATVITFGNTSDPITFVANEPTWIKWTQINSGNYVYIRINCGLDNGITEENITLDSVEFYVFNFKTIIQKTENANKSVGSSRWIIDMGSDIEFTDGEIYYAKITNPISGDFSIRVDFD